MIDNKIVAESAARFLTSRHPVVLLSIPGCGPCAISPAHWASRDLRFPRARRILVRSKVDFTGLIQWIATGKGMAQVSGELHKTLATIGCYCGKVLSILALRQRECVHEAHFEQFRDHGGALISLPGWEFNLLTASTTSRRRVYRALRTHSRLVAEVESPVLPSVTGLLEVRFVASKHLRLVVEGLPSRGSLTARVDFYGASRSPITVLPPFTSQVIPDNLPAYRLLEKQLERALGARNEAREILRHTPELLSGDGNVNYPAADVITGLLEPPRSCRQVPIKLLMKRIHSVAGRLWDAPVIAGIVRKRLDRALAEATFTDRVRALSLEAQVDLADVTMPLAKLEAGDAYLHVA